VAHELTLEGLGVTYGAATALLPTDLTFESGRIHVIVGPNGAGKSSMLLAIYGAVPSEGAVRLDGEPVSHLTPREKARLGISIVPQGRQIFPTLTVRENLEVMAELIGVDRRRVEAALSRFQPVAERSHLLAGLLSGGEQQMLAVARALMGDVRVVLLDEMTTGLAPIIVQELMRTARQLADDGTVVLLAAPSIGAIKHEIDTGHVLLRGEIVGSADDGDRLDRVYQERMGIVA